MDGGTIAPAPGSEPASRTDRLPLLAFLADPATATVLQEGLSGTIPGGFEIRRGNVRAALQALKKMVTPSALIIDITGEEQPLALLADLRHVVEPYVKVMVVGERQDVTFYRQVTRELGVAEYLYKPLTAEMVARHFGQQINRASGTVDGGGRLVCITGTRGGVGTTTLAVNVAWYLATIGRRHTVLLDTDLNTGTTAILLGCQTSPGFRSALERPDRIDELFVERSAMPVLDRLFLMAAEEPLTERPGYVAGAAEQLSTVLRRRFNYVVADAAFHGNEAARDMLAIAQQRVTVMLPTLSSVRDTLRLLALPAGAGQVRRPVIVLNRAGMPGGLARAAVEETLGTKVDVVIPDLPKIVGTAENLGSPVASSSATYRHAIAQLAREVGSIDAGTPRVSRWWRR